MLHRVFISLDEPLAVAKQTFCPMPYEGKLPYQLHYFKGYFPTLEKITCEIIAAFGVTLAPESKIYVPFIQDFVISLWIYAAVPLVEASRTSSPVSILFVGYLQFVAQALTGAAVLPVFWILLIGSRRTNHNYSHIRKIDAEAVFVATTFGYFLPSIGLLVYPSVATNLLWQLFPLIALLFSTLYRMWYLAVDDTRDGQNTILRLYETIFVISVVVHFNSIRNLDYHVHTLLQNWLPKLSLPRADGSPPALMVDILQWDGAIIWTSMTLASLWFVGGSFLESLLIISWYIIGSILFSPGAAVSAIWWWREKRSPGVSYPQKL
ncbi:hypothetical protein M422DRAFT_25451 [Sphaerobolus stellatus SS14]|nr:hypothetical protein M422DRAFT_25451 [Sphaerobolus stellatus SS14]